MCPKQVHEGRDDALHVPKVCVVMIDLGNLRDQIFPRTGFAPSEHLVWGLLLVFLLCNVIHPHDALPASRSSSIVLRRARHLLALEG